MNRERRDERKKKLERKRKLAGKHSSLKTIKPHQGKIVETEEK